MQQLGPQRPAVWVALQELPSLVAWVAEEEWQPMAALEVLEHQKPGQSVALACWVAKVDLEV